MFNIYRVIVKFKDLEDNNHIYEVGDIYPRNEIPSEERVNSLISDNNNLKKPLIRELTKEEKLNLKNNLNLDEKLENNSANLNLEDNQDLATNSEKNKLKKCKKK